MKITLNQVAQEAGVSKASVSYAFSSSEATRRKLSEAVRRHIEDVAFRLGYRPSALARGLAESRSYTIALLLPSRCAHNISTHYLEVFHGVSDALMSSDYTLAVYFGCEDKFLNNVRNGRIDGVLMVARLCHAHVYGELRELGVPIVVLNGLPEEEAEHFCSVSNDMEGWLGENLERMKRCGLSQVHLHLHECHARLIDHQLEVAFPGLCEKLGLEGRIYYADSEFQESFFVPSCGRIFRGDTRNLRSWLAHGMPGQAFCSVLLDHAMSEYLGIPQSISCYYSSEAMGHIGSEILLKCLAGSQEIVHCRVPVLSAGGGIQTMVADFEF